MTVEQYWDGECTLVRAFRQAQRLRDEREDTLAWLQGRYIYDALQRVSPLFHDFMKGKPKEIPYVEKPYMEMEKERKRVETREQMKRNGLAYMATYAERFNKRFKSKKTGGEQR